MKNGIILFSLEYGCFQIPPDIDCNVKQNTCRKLIDGVKWKEISFLTLCCKIGEIKDIENCNIMAENVFITSATWGSVKIYSFKVKTSFELFIGQILEIASHKEFGQIPPTKMKQIIEHHQNFISKMSKDLSSCLFKFGDDVLPPLVKCIAEIGRCDLMNALANYAFNVKGVFPLPPYYFVQAIVIASKLGHTDVVDLLNAEYDIPVDCDDEKGHCPLEMASANGHVSTVQLILDRGPYDSLDEKHRLDLPLLLAAHEGHTEICQMLLDLNADLEIRNAEDFTPLMLACQNGHHDCIAYLLSKGALTSSRNSVGWTPLMIGTFHGIPFSTLRLLIGDEKDVNNINLSGYNGSDLLILACYNGHEDMVKYLTERNVDITGCNKNGTTPLISAAKHGKLTIVDILIASALRQGVLKDVLRHQNKDGRNALMLAAGRGYTDITTVLLKYYDDLEAVDENGSTALILAIENQKKETALLLIASGASVNCQNQKNQTPLLLACQHDQLAPIVEQLVSKGANVNEIDETGMTPLLSACYQGHLQIVKALINNGANVSVKDDFGCNALIMAAKGGHSHLAKFLLQRNDIKNHINDKDNNGKTAIQYAKLRNFQDVTNVLKLAGASDSVLY